MPEKTNPEDDLFEATLLRSPGPERAAFLDGACRSDPELRARVEMMLRGPVGFLAQGNRLVVFLKAGNHLSEWDLAANREIQSPDGQRLATGGSNPDDAVKLWDVDSWQELLTLEGTGHGFERTDFSPDGNAIGTLSADGFLHVWQAPSWAEINAAEAKEKPGIKEP